jgi:serine/threonine protein kinase
MRKSDHSLVIDFELAATDFHRAAVNANDVPTGCTQWFPDGASFDRAITDTLSGLMFLHEHVNIYHNDIKPANLLIVRPNDVPKIVKIGDLGLCTEMDKRGRALGTFGYSSPEVHDSKRFSGDPTDATYAMLGKSDVFSVGLSLIFVTEGERPYQIPRDFQIAFEEFCNTHAGQSRSKLKLAMCAVASDFYYEQFSPKLL